MVTCLLCKNSTQIISLTEFNYDMQYFDFIALAMQPMPITAKLVSLITMCTW